MDIKRGIDKAVDAAVEEGVVPGGGLALVRVIQAVKARVSFPIINTLGNVDLFL